MVEDGALFNLTGDHCPLPDHLLWMRFSVGHKMSQEVLATAKQIKKQVKLLSLKKKALLVKFHNFFAMANMVNGLAFI